MRTGVDALGDTHITDAEGYLALTSAVSDTWDQLLSAGVGTEGIKSVTFGSVADQQEYPLASIAADFFQVRTLYVIDPDGKQRPLHRLNPSEEYVMQAPKAAVPLKLYYFPRAPVFTTGDETFDGINGWEEHTVQTACITVKAKKMDDTGPYRARKRELEARMSVMANRLRDEAPRVVRRAVRGLYGAFSGRGRDGYSIPYQTGVRGYDLRGANLELFA
jgi:hypothetical protein